MENTTPDINESVVTEIEEGVVVAVVIATGRAKIGCAKPRALAQLTGDCVVKSGSITMLGAVYVATTRAIQAEISLDIKESGIVDGAIGDRRPLRK